MTLERASLLELHCSESVASGMSHHESNQTAIIIIIIIIMAIFKCYFSGEHIALSINKNNNGVNIALGQTNRLKTLCMMQINT